MGEMMSHLHNELLDTPAQAGNRLKHTWITKCKTENIYHDIG